MAKGFERRNEPRSERGDNHFDVKCNDGVTRTVFASNAEAAKVFAARACEHSPLKPVKAAQAKRKAAPKKKAGKKR